MLGFIILLNDNYACAERIPLRFNVLIVFALTLSSCWGAITICNSNFLQVDIKFSFCSDHWVRTVSFQQDGPLPLSMISSCHMLLLFIININFKKLYIVVNLGTNTQIRCFNLIIYKTIILYKKERKLSLIQKKTKNNNKLNWAYIFVDDTI